ncbi:hypothetical protein FRACYDRAFT_258954 [Fragilariopsis cylindrus CCMP1102]|uniref:OCRE domain-containing protein n=1 Tax=Fragilariopsis cylindrus CCMP1102 TaxID=635003 RepID=A0A1E7FVK2_9STRA|nr:hypothetical protein FRACYDRAFT_258954 [Fragilariopsis cylindrus CCMP1102]|eukprot:OEU22179.1 hypothetical protein FRACYDRAFT_258954 [Fragilariopsis cylindrus CCMP1102]
MENREYRSMSRDGRGDSQRFAHRKSNNNYDDNDNNDDRYPFYDNDNGNTNDDYDVRGRRRITEKDNKQQRKPNEWPPSFENDGSAFVFDSRSAMFYESISDFFYDPKSKLYYGNKESSYFRYDETKEPPFVQVQKMTTEQLEQHEDNGGAVVVKNDGNNNSNQKTSKPKIAIKLKTIKLKTKKVKSSSLTAVVTASSSTCSTAEATTTISKVKKEQIANIEKWIKKGVESKQNNNNVTTTSSNSIEKATNKAVETISATKVRTTAKGKPICILCKRKFPNLDKLRLHEKSSDLHKQNVLKLQEKQQLQQQQQQKKEEGDDTKRKTDNKVVANTNTSTTSVGYTDRAEKRRRLHGSDLSAPANGIPSFRRRLPNEKSVLQFVESSQRQESISTTTTAPGSDPLNETNVGHQMLQRMGWKEKSSSTTASSSSDQIQQQQEQNRNTSDNDNLRKEWDRIEAMAANNNNSRPYGRSNSKNGIG